MSTGILKHKTSHKYLSKSAREAYVRRWQETNLSKSEFCKQEGINLSTFCGWLPKTAKSVFLPVKIAANQPKPKQLITSLKITLPSGLIIEGVFESSSLGSWLKEMS